MDIQLPRQGHGFVLRAFTCGDAEALADMELDPKVKGFLASPQTDRQKWLGKFNLDTFPAWAVEVNGALAGRASLSRAKRKWDAELVIVLGRDFLGRKLGRALAAMLIQIAFDELNAKAIVGFVQPAHIGSIGLLRAFKFRLRGTHAGPPDWQ